MTVENDDYLPPARTPWNEGKTVAAWVTTWLIVLGGAAIAVGMVLAEMALIVIGAVVVVLSLVAGRVLAILGHGKGGPGTAKRDQRFLSQGRGH